MTPPTSRRSLPSPPSPPTSEPPPAEPISRGHPPHRPLLRHERRTVRSRVRTGPDRLLAHIALRRRAAPHRADHPQPHHRRDRGVPAQDLRGPRLAARLPHRDRHGRLRRRSPSRPTTPSTPASAMLSRPKVSTPTSSASLIARAERDQTTLNAQQLSYHRRPAHEARHGAP